ncbi:MAG: hypothetical protein AB7G28_04680 [Pirellulales bacterium]
MNEAVPQFVERLDWEGLVDGRTALLIGLVIAAWTAWSLWRERAALGRAWAVVFFVLRMAAFGCVLWMLAGPTRLKIERTTTPQSVAIFADGSESMDVVDATDPAESIRWSLAIDGAAGESALRDCDRLLVDLGAAQSECQQLVQSVKEHRPVKDLQARTKSIGTLVERATKHVGLAAEALGDEDESLGERAARIETLLAGPAADSLDAVNKSLVQSDRNSAEALPARLEQFAESLQGAQRRAAVLASDLAQRLSDESAPERGETDRLTRREKIGQTLDAFEKSVKNELADGVQIRRFRFDQATSAVDPARGWSKSLEEAPATPAATSNDTKSGSTNLSSVFTQLSSERTATATRVALLLTDGRHNSSDGPAPQEVAAQLAGMNVYVVPIGSAVRVRDVLLHRVEAPATVAEKDSALIDVIVSAFDCDGDKTAVVLRHEGREVDRVPISFAGQQGDQRARFKVAADKLGWQEYVVEVEPVDDETNTANNYMPVSFEVVRDRTRVLLAEGVARWEYRYLNQLFRREQHVECDEILFSPRLHGTGKMAERPEFPSDVESWAAYDVVILGDLGPLQLSQTSQQALADAVRKRGCNLIVIAGENSMPARFAGQPLMDLLPVEQDTSVYAQEGYGVAVSDEGRFHSALQIAGSMEESIDQWRQVYARFPIYRLSDYSRPKSTARTLLAAVSDAAGGVAEDGAPKVEHAYLCWQRIGAGRVVYLAAPETWRLRFRRSDEMHHRFWGQLLRWITASTGGSGTDLVRLQTDRTNYLAGDTVEVTAWLKGPSGRPLATESIEAHAESFDDKSVSVDLTADGDVPGRYFAKLAGLAPGAYQITVRGEIVDKLVPPGAEVAMSTVTVRSTDNVEMMNTQCNRALLEQVAKVTGGQVIPPTAIDEVLQLVSFTPEVSERIERTTLWDRWSNLLLVLGCVFTEWTVRKLKGLV